MRIIDQPQPIMTIIDQKSKNQNYTNTNKNQLDSRISAEQTNPIGPCYCKAHHQDEDMAWEPYSNSEM
jgi:hypothetical protein